MYNIGMSVSSRRASAGFTSAPSTSKATSPQVATPVISKSNGGGGGSSQGMEFIETSFSPTQLKPVYTPNTSLSVAKAGTFSGERVFSSSGVAPSPLQPSLTPQYASGGLQQLQQPQDQFIRKNLFAPPQAREAKALSTQGMETRYQDETRTKQASAFIGDLVQRRFIEQSKEGKFVATEKGEKFFVGDVEKLYELEEKSYAKNALDIFIPSGKLTKGAELEFYKQGTREQIKAQKAQPQILERDDIVRVTETIIELPSETVTFDARDTEAGLDALNTGVDTGFGLTSPKSILLDIYKTDYTRNFLKPVRDIETSSGLYIKEITIPFINYKTDVRLSQGLEYLGTIGEETLIKSSLAVGRASTYNLGLFLPKTMQEKRNVQAELEEGEKYRLQLPQTLALTGILGGGGALLKKGAAKVLTGQVAKTEAASIVSYQITKKGIGSIIGEATTPLMPLIRIGGSAIKGGITLGSIQTGIDLTTGEIDIERSKSAFIGGAILGIGGGLARENIKFDTKKITESIKSNLDALGEYSKTSYDFYETPRARAIVLREDFSIRSQPTSIEPIFTGEIKEATRLLFTRPLYSLKGEFIGYEMLTQAIPKNIASGELFKPFLESRTKVLLKPQTQLKQLTYNPKTDFAPPKRETFFISSNEWKILRKPKNILPELKIEPSKAGDLFTGGQVIKKKVGGKLISISQQIQRQKESPIQRTETRSLALIRNKDIALFRQAQPLTIPQLKTLQTNQKQLQKQLFLIQIPKQKQKQETKQKQLFPTLTRMKVMDITILKILQKQQTFQPQKSKIIQVTPQITRIFQPERTTTKQPQTTIPKLIFPQITINILDLDIPTITKQPPRQKTPPMRPPKIPVLTLPRLEFRGEGKQSKGKQPKEVKRPDQYTASLLGVALGATTTKRKTKGIFSGYEIRGVRLN